MKTRLSTRLLSVLLVCALVLGMASPAAAMGSKSSVTFTQVDNSAVSVNPLTREDGELNTMDEYIATDVVRVSIVLEKASTIKAGFNTMGISGNEAAMAYRADLKLPRSAAGCRYGQCPRCHAGRLLPDHGPRHQLRR